MQAISWILFDLGGVVVPDNSRIMAQLAVELDVPANRLTDALKVYQDFATRGERRLLQIYGCVANDLGLAIDPKEILNRYLTLYKEVSTRHDPDVVAMINRLKSGYSVACLTNIEPEIAEICRETGLFEHFDRSYLSNEMGVKKPDPEAYKIVLDDLACQPEGVVFVDDQEENVEGARAVGMHGLQFVNLAQFQRDLLRLCPF